MGEPILPYHFTGRVPGEAAHDLAEATVAKFGGRMLTQHAPVLSAEAGVVYYPTAPRLSIAHHR